MLGRADDRRLHPLRQERVQARRRLPSGVLPANRFDEARTAGLAAGPAAGAFAAFVATAGAFVAVILNVGIDPWLINQNDCLISSLMNFSLGLHELTYD